MRRLYSSTFMLWLLLAGSTSLAAAQQTLAPDLEKVSAGVEDFFRQTRQEWKHETVPPPTPPGVPPGPDIAIHFWWSDKCLTAEVIIDGANSGAHPVPCRIKLAIMRADSAAEAQAKLSDFILREQSASPLQIGDKAYVWRGSEIVFLKGKFSFWLGGGLTMRVGDFTNNKEFMEKLAREIADAVPSN